MPSETAPPSSALWPPSSAIIPVSGLFSALLPLAGALRWGYRQEGPSALPCLGKSPQGAVTGLCGVHTFFFTHQGSEELYGER